MTQRTDARGQVTDFAYDGLGRMTTRSFPSAPTETITWSYDSTAGGNKGVGQLTGITDPSGTVAYAWNALGQMTHVTRVIGARTYDSDYAYDKAGNVTEMTLPSGRIVTYTRDSLARVTSVTTKDNSGASTNTVVSSATWRPFGPLASFTFGNSINLTLSYDNDGRVADIDAAGSVATVQDLHYGYDAASNITSIADNLTSGRSQTFAYDNLNRLTSASGLYGTNTYAYDSVGNRTQKTVTAPFASTDTYTNASTSNRLNSIAGGTARSLTYAASGQTATDQRSPVDTWTYTIDKNGRMADAVLNSVTQASFAYDADELRIRKTNATTSAVTHYIYDPDGQLIAEMDGATGNPIREYVWLGALPIGYVDRLGTSGASRLFFIHADHLARPQKITDSSRATVWDGVFAPFGEIHAITGSIVSVLMFPGQVYDLETGLTQNWHRDYDANIGRYFQSDPIGLEGGINTYAYVGGNPAGTTDPMGLQQLRPAERTSGGFSYSWNGSFGRAAYSQQIAQYNRQLIEYGRAEWTFEYVGSPNQRDVDVLRISVDLARFEYQIRQAEAQRVCRSGIPSAGRYEFPDLTANGRPYIGQSSNIPRRLDEQARAGRYEPGTASTTEVLGGRVAREISEHLRIQEITGGVPASRSDAVSNRRDPIGPARRHLLRRP